MAYEWAAYLDTELQGLFLYFQVLFQNKRMIASFKMNFAQKWLNLESLLLFSYLSFDVASDVRLAKVDVWQCTLEASLTLNSTLQHGLTIATQSHQMGNFI